MNNWRDEVDALCKKFGAEPLIVEGDNTNVKKMCITSPKDLAGEEQAAIARCIPKDVVCVFKATPSDWKNLLNKICAKLNVEPVISKRDPTNDAIQTISFNCPREMSADERSIIIDPVPQGIEMQFNVAPKQSTIGNLRVALLFIGTKIESVNYDLETRTLEITGRGLVLPTPMGEEVNLGEILSELPQVVWDKLSCCLKGDGAIDSCKLTCDTLNIDLDVKNAKDNSDDIVKLGADVAEQIRQADAEAVDEIERNDPPVRTRLSPKPGMKPVAEQGTGGRETCPTTDEILDLKIDLGKAQSVDDFLRAMGVNPDEKPKY
jgi:hypothetical protein